MSFKNNRGAMAEDKPDQKDEKTPLDKEGTADQAAPQDQEPSSSENSIADATEAIGPKTSTGEEMDLDEDLADALDVDLSGDSSVAEDEVDVDAVIAEADPEFADEINQIAGQDFSGVVIDTGKVSEQVDEEAKLPSPLRSFINNLPKEVKKRYTTVAVLLITMLPLSLLIYKGYILPKFELPYNMSMDEVSKKVFTYPKEGVKVPLFDEFRTNAHTVELPKTVINLQNSKGSTSYGEFKFSLVLGDKNLSTAIEAKSSEIIDLIQRVLEQMSIEELETPRGKEKVKKIIRHRINEYLQGKVIIGVYYQSVILER